MITSKILEVENISKRFGGIVALNHCSFAAEQGHITALIGPNGSGKSTMFHVLSRLVQEDAGEIKFKGEEIISKNDFQVARRGLSRTFQEVRLFRNLTIQDHLELALNDKDEKLQSILLKKKNHLPRIKEILALVKLSKSLSVLATELSYGQRKLLDLAMALAQRHELLMLDEPVAGV
ncbi:MAG: ATP-binding cassette domain-containing protein, partial [Nanoarchaeota archaeon]